MNDRKSGRRRLLVALLLLFALGGVVVGTLFRAIPRQMLVREWLDQLDELPAAEIRPRLVQISELGDDAIPALVVTLGSRREICILTAEWLLRKAMDDWKRLDSETSTTKAVALSDLLAASVRDFGPLGRSAAASLATDLLLWPSTGHPGAGALVQNCETVFRAAIAMPLPRPPANAMGIADRAPGSAGDGQTNLGRLNAEPLDLRNPLAADLPGGALRVAPVQIPAQAVGLARWPGLPPKRGDEPDLLPAPFNPQPELFLPSESMQLPGPAVEPGEIEPGAPPPSMDALGQLDDRELMKLLGDPQSGALAEIQLRRRGFGDAMIDMARRAMNSDPRVRGELADMLPRLPVDARPWLLLLAEDSHPQVRITAYRWMLTSRDARLHEIVRRAALKDTDPDNRRVLHGWLDRLDQ